MKKAVVHLKRCKGVRQMIGTPQSGADRCATAESRVRANWSNVFTVNIPHIDYFEPSEFEIGALSLGAMPTRAKVKNTPKTFYKDLLFVTLRYSLFHLGNVFHFWTRIFRTGHNSTYLQRPALAT